jgi:hypothetical protein
METTVFLPAIENRNDIDQSCLKWLIAVITRENIEAHFAQLGVPKEFDLLSLDIDQNTWYAWEGLRSFKPRVVVIVYNSFVPADVDWKVAFHSDRRWDGTKNLAQASRLSNFWDANSGTLW